MTVVQAKDVKISVKIDGEWRELGLASGIRGKSFSQVIVDDIWEDPPPKMERFSTTVSISGFDQRAFDIMIAVDHARKMMLAMGDYTYAPISEIQSISPMRLHMKE